MLKGEGAADARIHCHGGATDGFEGGGGVITPQGTAAVAAGPDKAVFLANLESNV